MILYCFCPTGTFWIVSRRLLSALFFALVLSAWCANPAFSQEIISKVSITTDPLPTNKKEELRDFAPKVEQYISSYNWTQGKYPYSLNCQVGIFFEEFRSTYEDRYSGRFYIASETGIQHVDKYWDFAFNRGDNFAHGQPDFSPFLGLIDYYIYLVLGEEMDKVGPLQGTPYFQKALDLGNQGKFCRLPRWWDERVKYAQLFLREDHKPFRLLLSRFEQIVTFLNDGNKEETKRLSADFFKDLLEITKVEQERPFCKNFFEQNYKELLAIVKLFPGDAMYNLLVSMDADHTDYYKNNR